MNVRILFEICNARVQWLETSVLIDLRTKQTGFSFFALEYERNFFCDHRDWAESKKVFLSFVVKKSVEYNLAPL